MEGRATPNDVQLPQGAPAEWVLERLGAVSFLVVRGFCGLEWFPDITPGDDRLRRGRSVGVVASRGPGRPRKTPGKTIRADSHEFALAT